MAGIAAGARRPGSRGRRSGPGAGRQPLEQHGTAPIWRGSGADLRAVCRGTMRRWTSHRADARRRARQTSADRLLGRSAAGPGDAGDGDGRVGAEPPQRALAPWPRATGSLTAPCWSQQSSGDAEQRDLHRVVVGDDAATERRPNCPGSSVSRRADSRRRCRTRRSRWSRPRSRGGSSTTRGEVGLALTVHPVLPARSQRTRGRRPRAARRPRRAADSRR